MEKTICLPTRVNTPINTVVINYIVLLKLHTCSLNYLSWPIIIYMKKNTPLNSGIYIHLQWKILIWLITNKIKTISIFSNRYTCKPIAWIMYVATFQIETYLKCNIFFSLPFHFLFLAFFQFS